MLDGSIDGIVQMLKPNWSLLFETKIWSQAAQTNFFLISNGYGVSQTLASFRKVNKPIVKFSIWAPLIISLTGVLSSLVVYGYLGFYMKEQNLTLEELPISGPELLFVTYPGIFTTMPFTNLWMF